RADRLPSRQAHRGRGHRGRSRRRRVTAMLLRNAANVATGDVHAPLIPGPIDVRIIDGRIAAIGRSDGANADEVLDASGLLATPGLWDAHYHPYFGDQSTQF